MRHLIIGAGATLAEALHMGCAQELCPPLIRDFARKTWMNYAPHPLLEMYLQQLGYTDLGNDPREVFYRLEEQGKVNIERFFEFAWVNRNRECKADLDRVVPGFISGLRIGEAGGSVVKDTPDAGGGYWDNLLYHGIGYPLAFLMQQCFFENGKGWKDLVLSKRFAASLAPEDLVLNLNYDTVFEIALSQANKPFTYSPNIPKADQLLVCKPHGSLNMVSNDRFFTWGQPEWLGMPQPREFRSYSGLIPPQLNKSYSQHPIARKIIQPVAARDPKQIIMWGVGLTESDVDLVEIYRAWAAHAKEIEIINPSREVVKRVRSLTSFNIQYFSSIDEWEQEHL